MIYRTEPFFDAEYVRIQT